MQLAYHRAHPLKTSGRNRDDRRHRSAPNSPSVQERHHRPMSHDVTLYGDNGVYSPSTFKTHRSPPKIGMSLPIDKHLPDATQTHEELLTLRAPRDKTTSVVRSTIASGPAANSADARKNKKKRNSKPTSTHTRLELTPARKHTTGR